MPPPGAKDRLQWKYCTGPAETFLIVYGGAGAALTAAVSWPLRAAAMAARRAAVGRQRGSCRPRHNALGKTGRHDRSKVRL